MENVTANMVIAIKISNAVRKLIVAYLHKRIIRLTVFELILSNL